MQLTESSKLMFIQTANNLKNSMRRIFMAQVVKELGRGGQRLAEEELGWSRVTIRKGAKELESGISCIEAFNLRGRKPCQEKLTRLLSDIQAIIDSQSQTDPKFRSTRLYTRVSAREVRHQLIIQKGYKDQDLPCEKTIELKIKQLGYSLKKVAKIKPQKKLQKQTQFSKKFIE